MTRTQDVSVRAATAQRTSTFTESVIREMTRVANQYGAINLAQGFPDFPMPEPMKDAACAAIRGDINQYAITWGSPALRIAIAEKYRSWYGMEVDPEREITVPAGIVLSDKVCSALQLTEHWQDVGEDCARDRVYLPAEDLRRFGVADTDLAAATATAEVKALMEFEVKRARVLLREGVPLAHTLPGRCSLAVAAFVGGGRAALKAIERAGYDVLGAPPRPGRLRRALETAAILVRR